MMTGEQQRISALMGAAFMLPFLSVADSFMEKNPELWPADLKAKRDGMIAAYIRAVRFTAKTVAPDEDPKVFSGSGFDLLKVIADAIAAVLDAPPGDVGRVCDEIAKALGLPPEVEA